MTSLKILLPLYLISGTMLAEIDKDALANTLPDVVNASRTFARIVDLLTRNQSGPLFHKNPKLFKSLETQKSSDYCYYTEIMIRLINYKNTNANAHQIITVLINGYDKLRNIKKEVFKSMIDDMNNKLREQFASNKRTSQ